MEKLRTIAAIYPNYIQIVATADSKIKTLADLKGKSLSVGAPKSGTELNSRAILAAAGMTYKDFAKVEYLPFGESVELMKNRQLDVTLQSAGLGVASLRDLATSVDITVVAVPEEIVDKIGPPFVAAIIPANTYTGQDKDVPTAAVINYLVTSSDVSDDVVYQMTKLIFESLPELANAHVAGKEIKLESAADRQPGAAASRREKLLQGKRRDEVGLVSEALVRRLDERAGSTKQSILPQAAQWIAVASLAMTSDGASGAIDECIERQYYCGVEGRVDAAGRRRGGARQGRIRQFRARLPRGFWPRLVGASRLCRRHRVCRLPALVAAFN